VEVTVLVGEDLNILGIALFCAAGLLNGFLFRDVGLIKIIAIFFVLPFCVDLLINLNNLYQATIPFLVFAVVGYLGGQKSFLYLEHVFCFLKDRIGNRS